MPIQFPILRAGPFYLLGKDPSPDWKANRLSLIKGSQKMNNGGVKEMVGDYKKGNIDMYTVPVATKRCAETAEAA